MPSVKPLRVSKADVLRESLNAQAVLIFAVQKDGSVEAVTSGDTPFHDKVVTNWSETFPKSAIGPVPFHTVFGHGTEGVPMPLKPEERASLPQPVQFSFVELGWMTETGEPPNTKTAVSNTAGETSVVREVAGTNHTRVVYLTADAMPSTWSGISLPVARRSFAFLISGMLADKLAVLGTAEIALTLKVVDARPRVDPDELVAGTRHAGRGRMLWRLCPG